MAVKGKKNSPQHKIKRAKKIQLLTGYNLTILVLGVTSIIFVASIVNRHMRGGMIIEDFSKPTPPPLINFTNYDNSLLKDIEAEVLNGCGISGIAQQFTDYFRNNYIDVIRTENADNFNYDKTIVILRRGAIEQAEQIAKLLEISPRDSIRVIVDPDGSLLTDITIVIGSDYLNIEPVQRFLTTQL